MKIFSKKQFVAWYFIIPVAFIHLFVIGIPSISSLALSLTDWRGLGKINYIGLENFIELLDDRYLKKAIFNNIIWTIAFLTVPVLIALTCAYLLTGIKRGQMFFRLAFFFPYMLASVINCQVWKYLFHPIHGLGGFFDRIGWEFLAVSPFTTKSTSLFAVAFVDGWHFWGFLVVIYLTGMYQVDNHLYEAADLEGATKFQKFRYITLPMIRPVFVFSIMIIVIWSVPVFDYVYILTGGGPAYSSEVIANYMYSQAFERFDVGYSSAIGTLMFFYVMFIVAVFGLFRKMGWDI